MTHALFGGPASAGSSGSRNLVEFKAGKLTLKNGWVHPVNKKGLVYVYQGDDGLMHLCWKDRTSGTVEDDLIIFPDDIEFKKVNQCTTGRVYLLRFKSSTKKYFFWMQEPKEEKDVEICRKVNEYLNNPPAPSSSRSNGAGGAGSIASALSGLGESDLSGMLGNMSQAELMQLLQMSMQLGMSPGSGSGRPQSSTSESSEQNIPSRVQSSPGERPSAAQLESSNQPRPMTAIGATSQDSEIGGSQGRIQLCDLQNILSSIVPREKREAGIELNDLLTSERLIPLLADSDIQDRLLPHLPEASDIPRTVQELRASISSPQFRQCVSAFSAALLTGELAPVIGQFGLGPDVEQAAQEGNLLKFVKALEARSENTDVEMQDESDKTGEKPAEEKMDDS